MKTHRSPSRAEAGSAYIITLLALVVLTILALSLALVTQTEVVIGANERTVNRTFYAADSGLGIAAAEALSSGKYSGGITVILNKTSVGFGGGSANIADRVTLTRFVPIQVSPCDWCPYNANGVPKFWKVNSTVSATAQRVAWAGSGNPPADATLLGQKSMNAMFEFQPWPKPPVESFPTLGDPDLEKIKF
jgi:Tfp pilus assembly protein PilX